MKKFKKITALLMASLMMMSLAACVFDEVDDSGKETASETSSQPESKEQTESAEQTETEEQTESAAETETEAEEKETESQTESQTESSSQPETKQDAAEKETEKETEYKPDWDEIPAKEAPELKGEYSGSFTSNTETPLDLIVRWAADPSSDGKYKVTVQYFIKSYEIMAGERKDSAVIVKAGEGEGKEYKFTTYAVGKTATSYGETYLGGTEFELTEEELKAGAKAEASWNFKGNYAGKDLPVVKAEGTISAQ